MLIFVWKSSLRGKNTAMKLALIWKAFSGDRKYIMCYNTLELKGTWKMESKTSILDDKNLEIVVVLPLQHSTRF